ncbi:hypothetical protein F4809DRAFT_664140 [Biscogniauxia mediterranea]|nr:hypothetical protein F4809DRAFT_664140 [Biscogniauxia mediterranea]
MSTGCPPDACQACKQDYVLCELTCNNPGLAIPAGCVECSNAGEGCAIPIIDNVMINNGIPTVSFGHRSCVRCAANGLSCNFPSGTRPTPCLYCINTRQLCCVIPPRVEESVTESSLEATSYNYDMPSNEGFQPLFGEDYGEYVSYPEPDMYEQLADNLFYQPELAEPDMQAETPHPSATEFYLEGLSMVSYGDTTPQLDLLSVEEEMDHFVSQLPVDSQMDPEDDDSIAQPSPPFPRTPYSAIFSPTSWTIPSPDQ